MLNAGLPFLQLQWLQLCTYKVQNHVQVRFLRYLLSYYDCKISVALEIGVVLPFAWSSISGDAVLVVLPRQLGNVQQKDSIGTYDQTTG